jgi:hypothetical protein
MRTAAWTCSAVSPCWQTARSWLSMHMPKPFTAETASDHSSNVALSTLGRAMTFIRRFAGMLG